MDRKLAYLLVLLGEFRDRHYLDKYENERLVLNIYDGHYIAQTLVRLDLHPLV